ncbi:MAG: hypothetical protein ABI091_31530 [Ferruginibacter sp.]
MSCCCDKTYKFCKGVGTCNADDFKKMFTGLADGTYTVQLDFLDSKVNITITVATNVVTVADPFILNENYTYTGKVIKADGTTAMLIEDTISYDCFEFTTQQTITVN